MRLPSVSNILHKKYASDTEGYIKLRIGLPGRSAPVMKSYGYKVAAHQWDEVNEIVRKSHGDASAINAEISARKDELLDLFKAEAKRDRVFNIEYINQVLRPGRAKGSFLQFYDDYIEHLRKRKLSDDYINHFVIEFNALKKFAGDDINFDDVTASFMERYEADHDCEPTTLYTKMKRLKEVVDRAVKFEKIKSSQVAGYKLPANVEPETHYLTLEQTETIWNNIITGEYDFDATIKKVACYFLIECYAGIRFSDWKSFVVEKLMHDRNLKVRTKKNKEPVYLPLGTFKRLALIIDYVHDNNIRFDLSEQATNRTLKVIGQGLKLKFPLRTHIGRHTCGTLLGEMRYNTREIAEVLGITPKTAERYIKVTRQGLNYAFGTLGGL